MPTFYRGVMFTLDPTPTQTQALASAVGAARFAYNTMLTTVQADLERVQKAREAGAEADYQVGWSHYSLRKHWNSIKAEVAPWWSEVSKETFSSGCKDLSAALANFRSSKKGHRKGARMGFPRLKKRGAGDSATFATGSGALGISGHTRVKLPKIGRIHTLEPTTRLARKIEAGQARILAATVKKYRGRWVVSFRVEYTTEHAPSHPHPGSVVGVDLGVRHWIVAADACGREVMRLTRPEAITALEKRKRRLARQGRRKVKGSTRWVKHMHRLAALDHRIANLRDDALHKATTALARRFETVVVEDLAAKNMMAKGGARKRGLNRHLGYASVRKTRSFLEYKTTQNGGKILTVDRFYPSSKTCSGCGRVKARLDLTQRVFACPGCGLRVDRDLNAARNLAAVAGSAPVSAHGADCKTASGVYPAGAVGVEVRSPVGVAHASNGMVWV